MGHGVDLLGTVTRIFPERLAPEVAAGHLDRVLIVKLSSIGDVVHALPVATALKRTYPGLHISWAIARWTAPLLRHHPAIDRLIVIPGDGHGRESFAFWRAVGRAWRELRRDTYDVILDLQGLAKSAIISRMARGTVRLARIGQREGSHLVSRAVSLPGPRAHAVEEYLALARFLGASVEPVRFDLPVQAPAVSAVESVLRRHGVEPGTRLIVVSPTTAKGWRRWPPGQWAAVIDGLEPAGAVVLSGHRDHVSWHKQILASVRSRVICLTGRTTLEELVALLSLADLHVAPDSGSVHIAAALGTPVVALFGPTPAWRLAPYDQAHLVVDHGDRCGWGCPAYCVRGRRCVSAVTAEEVIEKAVEALKEKARPMTSAVTRSPRTRRAGRPAP